MSTKFTFFRTIFVKYLNHPLRLRGPSLSFAIANYILFHQFRPSSSIENINSIKLDLKVPDYPHILYDNLKTSLSSLLSPKIAYAEQEHEVKSCCSTTDPKVSPSYLSKSQDLVLTDKALEKILFEIQTYEVVLFMKGNARTPRCGFSKQALEILKALKISTIRTVDVLEDAELRNGLKVYSKYPNLPQLYVRGKFVGGLEKMAQMYSDGSLEKLIRDG